MADFEFEGMDELIYSYIRHEEEATNTIEEMVNAETEIYLEEQKNSIKNYGLVNTGGFLASIKAQPIKRDGTEVYRIILPQGRANHKSEWGGKKGTEKRKKKKGTAENVRYASIGYIYEYGTSSITPRPWMTKANNEAENKAYKKAFDIWKRYVDKSF